jgi:virginiamycin B lyase
MKAYFERVKSVGIRGRFFMLAILFTVASVVGVLPFSHQAHAAIGTATEYSSGLPSTPYAANLNGIALGPDGNIWYTATNIYSHIGKMTPSGVVTNYVLSTYTDQNIGSVAKGSDGNIWFVDGSPSASTPQIVKMNTSGAVLNRYYMPTNHPVLNLSLGPDGNLWFAEGSYRVGTITPSGTITEYSVVWGSNSIPNIRNITAGPDGNLWYTSEDTGGNYSGIGKVTTSGVSTFYQIPNAIQTQLGGITGGSDGNVWFTEANKAKVGKITPSGTITEYPTSLPATLMGITTGSDGALWLPAANKIVRMTTAGVVTSYTIPSTGGNTTGSIVTGSDGAVWYLKSNSIGRMATELTHQTVSFTSTAPTNAVINGPTYTPAASATSGLSVAITVDPSSSSVCAIDGSGVVSFQGYGTCTLNANQGGNVDYSPATQVQQSFTVLPVDADTAVSLGCDPTGTVGNTVTCTITVTNNGPAASQNATLTALFSNMFSSVSLSGGGTVSGQNITWATPSLASGASTTLTFTGTATTVGKARFNAALLQTSPDPDNSNNIVASTIVIS